jgi:hypothetical protein
MVSKDKQYRTRDGREVRIYATDGYGPFCLHGAIAVYDEKKTIVGWVLRLWREDGSTGLKENESHDWDLINLNMGDK